MIKITQTEEMLKRVSKNDVIWFFKSIMMDKNLTTGAAINLLSAGYSKSERHRHYAPDGETKVKALIVKMNLAGAGKREYFEFYLVRDSKKNVVFHRSISRIETIENHTKTKKNAKDSVPA
jgi:hypothetical protein